jgi:hypothetical protein
MPQTFKIKKGEIKFYEDKICISDNAQEKKRNRLISSFLLLFFGLMSVLRYQKTGDEFLLWSGLIIGLGHFFILVYNYFLSTQSEIPIDEVKCVKIGKVLMGKYLGFKLKSNKLRRVFINNDSILHQFVEANFKQ